MSRSKDKAYIKYENENRLRSNRVRGYYSKDPVDREMSRKAYADLRKRKREVGKKLDSYMENPLKGKGALGRVK